jgi:hypothetical protein
LCTVLPAARPLRIERFNPHLEDREALGVVARYWT